MPARIEIQGTAIDPGELPPEIRARTEADDPRYENGVKTYRIERTASGEIIKTRLYPDAGELGAASKKVHK
jgi:hypothetical protein